jgi:hypothetical protein
MAFGYSAVDLMLSPYLRQTGLSAWFYPLVTVLAPDREAADALAGPDPAAIVSFAVAMDSIAAQCRLGLFGGSRAQFNKMLRGD